MPSLKAVLSAAFFFIAASRSFIVFSMAAFSSGDMSRACSLVNLPCCGRLLHGSALARPLLQVEVDRHRVAQARAHALDVVHDLPVHFERDDVRAERQSGVEVMALLVGFNFVAALDVRPVDFDQRAFERLAVFTLHVAFER